jgi:hypothetical protein
MKFTRCLLAASILLTAGCSLDDDALGLAIFSETFDFEESEHDWDYGFSDFPAGPRDSTYYQLKYTYKDTLGYQCAMLSGDNHSADLFMYLKRKVSGLKPNTDFTVSIELTFTTAVPSTVAGSNISPGEAVFMKVGAASIEPKPVLDDNLYVMNIDKGNHSEGGTNMVTVGNTAPPPGSAGYVTLSRTNSLNSNGAPLVVRSNANGEVWLIVGTDSSAKGTTTIFYKSINVALSSSY